jgi:hypothetical protein
MHIRGHHRPVSPDYFPGAVLALTKRRVFRDIAYRMIRSLESDAGAAILTTKYPTTSIGTAIGWILTLVLVVAMLGNFGLVVLTLSLHFGAWLGDVVHESLGRAAMVVGAGIALVVGLGVVIVIATVLGFGTARVVERVKM